MTRRRVQGSQFTRFGLLALLSALLLSCESVQYYSQAARGQMEIVFGRQAIDDLLARSDLPTELRDKLETVQSIREFAAAELGLIVESNYATYVDLGREHVVWNVFAAPEFSTQAVEWCYPIAGCVTYRGYFSETSAERYAEDLAEDGLDVYTGGVDAYSTLGWFDDSLLSTVIGRSEHQLAGLIFHELAHQMVYLPGDTTFNESYATAVEREGVKRWLARTQQESLIEDAERSLERQRQFAELVTEWREKFADLYQQEQSVMEMRAEKALLQESLRQAYRELKMEWNGYSGYDNWFAQSLNNAQLSTVAFYNELVPAFTELLQGYGDDWSAFYEAVRDLANQPEQVRADNLDALLN